MPEFKNKEEYEKWKTEKLNKTQEDSHGKTSETNMANPLPQKHEQTSKVSQQCSSKIELTEFVKDFFTSAHPPGSIWTAACRTLYHGKLITKEKLERACNYARYDLDNEKILLLFDDRSRSLKNGFVMTDNCFYYITDGEKGKLLLEEITTIKTSRILGGMGGFVLTLNGKWLRFPVPFALNMKELDILQSFFIKMSIDILKIDLDKSTKEQEEILNKVKSNMVRGENIIFYAWDITDRFFEIDSGICVACTNYRLIICYFNSTGLIQRIDMPYDQITSVWVSGDSIFSLLTACKIRISAAQSVPALTGFRYSDAEQIEKIVIQQKNFKIDLYTKGQISTSDKIDDMSQEIIKLRNLLDCGALTQEEFDKAKKKLLDQL